MLAIQRFLSLSLLPTNYDKLRDPNLIRSLLSIPIEILDQCPDLFCYCLPVSMEDRANNFTGRDILYGFLEFSCLIIASDQRHYSVFMQLSKMWNSF